MAGIRKIITLDSEKQKTDLSVLAAKKGMNLKNYIEHLIREHLKKSN